MKIKAITKQSRYEIIYIFFRRCPRLNKRWNNIEEGDKRVKKVLDEVINNIFRSTLNETKSNTPEENINDEEVINVKQPQKKLTWTCPICKVIIQHTKNVPRHQAICPSVKEIPKEKPKAKMIATVFNCDYCEACFSLQKSLTAHEKRNHVEQFCIKHKDTLINCSQCNFKSTAEKYLKIHVKKFHMEKGTFTCDTCEKQYANRDSLRVHVKTHHISVQSGFVCEVCGCVIVTAGPEGAHTCVANSDSQVYNNNTQMYPALSPAIGCEGEWQEDWHGGGFDDSSRFPQVRQEQVNTRVLVMETRHSHAGHSQAEHSQ